MTPDLTPQPPGPDEGGYLASGPRRNTQFGQEIGVDDTDPPQVAHGQRARESELVEDRYAGVRARFVRPMDHRPPAQEASEASEFGEPETGPPTSDAALPDDLPSVWDASPPAPGGDDRR
jgi:hypothetical protein